MRQLILDSGLPPARNGKRDRIKELETCLWILESDTILTQIIRESGIPTPESLRDGEICDVVLALVFSITRRLFGTDELAHIDLTDLNDLRTRCRFHGYGSVLRAQSIDPEVSFNPLQTWASTLMNELPYTSRVLKNSATCRFEGIVE